MAEMNLAKARQFFNEALFDSENLDVDTIYDAVDACTSAQKLAFEIEDVELEARCEAFQGMIFYKGLRKLEKARHHLYNTIRFEFSFRPSTFGTKGWFVTC